MKISPKMVNTLISLAEQSREKAIATYSSFRVGAALLTKRGKIYSGCNIESSSFSLTICAERVALVKALSEGDTEFSHIAIVGPSDDYCPPCGACRQLLYDYAPELEIILKSKNQIKTISLKELLPIAFEDKQLRRK